MKLELNIDREDDFLIGMTQNGLAYDLTGCGISVACKLVRTPAAPAIFTKAIGTGIAVPNPKTGVFQLSIAPADKTALNELISPFWDLLLTDPFGNPVPVEGLAGRVAVNPSLQ